MNTFLYNWKEERNDEVNKRERDTSTTTTTTAAAAITPKPCISDMSLFNEDGVSNLLPKDGRVNYYGKVLTSKEANQYLDLLMQNILWENNEVIIFGKHIITKIKTAWYGDSDYLYTFSSTTKQALAWTKELSDLKQIVEELAGTKFNSSLLNLYHNGNKGMGWHSDDEKSLGKNNTIASLSLGGERKFLQEFH